MEIMEGFIRPGFLFFWVEVALVEVLLKTLQLTGTYTGMSMVLSKWNITPI